jgi:hypothetical protein
LAFEISVPFGARVGEAEINTWADGRRNLIFLYLKRFGLNRTRSAWGPLKE